jgi:hypothetical protein
VENKDIKRLAAARENDDILFFDEADSLLSKRVSPAQPPSTRTATA